MAHVPKPIEKRKQREIFLSLEACSPTMIGIGKVNIQTSATRFVTLVKYVKATRFIHSPLAPPQNA
jgi:hypothetical protein